MLSYDFRRGMQYLLYSEGRIKKVKYKIHKCFIEVEGFYLGFDEQVGFSRFETEARGYFY